MAVLSTTGSLRFLAEAGRALAESLELQSTLDGVAGLVIPRLADLCAIHLADAEGELQRVAAAHSDPEKMRLAVDLYAKFPIRKDSVHGVAKVFRTGEPELLAHVAEENLARVAKTPEQLEILKSLGLRSSIIVPLKARGRIIGALSLVMGDSGRNFDGEDLLLAEELGQRIAVAVDNARLFQETRRQAEDLRKAESDLRRSQELMRGALNASDVAVTVQEPSGTFLFANDAQAKVLGFVDVAEMLAVPGGLTARVDLFHEDGRPLLQEEFAITLARKGEAVRQRIMRVRPKGGGPERWYEVHAAPIRDGSGEIKLVVSNVHDITRLKETQEALRAGEERLRLAMEAGRIGAWEWDIRTGAITWSERVYEMHGVEPGTFSGRMEDFTNRIHPEDAARVGESIRKVVEEGASYQIEFRVVRPSGEVRWIATSAHLEKGEGGSPARLIGATIDVHDQRLAREALIKSEEEFRAMFELAGSGKMQAVAATGRLLRVNRRFCAVAGRAEAELLAMAYQDLFYDEDRPAVDALLDEVRRGLRKEWYVEARFARGDGTLRWVQVTGTVLAERDGDPGRLLATVHDVTERKMAEEEARTSQEKFRQSQKLESIGRLAGGIAHDFNNLLTAINGYADLLLMQMARDTSHAGYVREIRQSGERAASLTRQLLAYSRRQILTPKVTDLNGIVLRQVNMLGRLIGETIRLSTDLEASLPMIKVDPGQMEQVILNLAVNARDAMPDGGNLVIRTVSRELGQPEEAHDAVVPAGRYVVLEVEDTGHGMGKDVLARLFEPFFTTKEVGKGTGLGLSMVQGIVRQSDAFIRVESAPREGSRFTILFPAVDAASAGSPEGAETKAFPEATGAGITVLLVEDEDSVRRYAAEILARSGYEVLAASSGGEAVRLADSHPGEIHLLVSDVVMPGMTGPRLAETLAASRPRMKVLFMSGYSDASILRYGIMGERGSFLQKPFSPADLLGKAREVLVHLPA